MCYICLFAWFIHSSLPCSFIKQMPSYKALCQATWRDQTHVLPQFCLSEKKGPAFVLCYQTPISRDTCCLPYWAGSLNILKTSVAGLSALDFPGSSISFLFLLFTSLYFLPAWPLSAPRAQPGGSSLFFFFSTHSLSVPTWIQLAPTLRWAPDSYL